MLTCEAPRSFVGQTGSSLTAEPNNRVGQFAAEARVLL